MEKAQFFNISTFTALNNDDNRIEKAINSPNEKQGQSFKQNVS